jgi:hypothetical protein
MTYLVAFLVLILVALLVAACVVVFALLKRLEAANRAVLDQAQQVLAMASERDKAAPRMIDKMLANLADSTERIHATIKSTVETVLTPPPVQIVDGPGQPFPMPVQAPDAQDMKPWDHTDSFLPNFDTGPRADGGWLDEDADVDPDNPMGIPGLSAPWASPKTPVGV